jgi:hypothetical protein
MVRRYRQDPSAFAVHFPELAHEIGEALGQGPMPGQHPAPPSTRTGPDPKRAAIERLLRRYRKAGTASPEEAAAALERLAALGKRDPGLAGEVIALAERGLGFPFDGSRQSMVLRGDEPPVRWYVPQLGVRLGLNEGGRLLRIEVDRAKREYREKALSIVASGRDAASDVAVHHDDYLTESVW